MNALTDFGFHHITMIAEDAAENVRFYRDILGLRMVKKTVNFDDPSAYHLYYGDALGAPGTALTFFPYPGSRRGRPGTGMFTRLDLGVPVGALEFWSKRLRALGVDNLERVTRFGIEGLEFADPDGFQMRLEESALSSPNVAWPGQPVASEYLIQGVIGMVLQPDDGVFGTSDDVIERVLGYRRASDEGHTVRYAHPNLPNRLDVVREPGATRGLSGAGSVHHVAFRIANPDDQKTLLASLVGEGFHASNVTERNYFQSIYFREPGHALLEVATDEPGFLIDETFETLGTKLLLPDQYEPMRSRIEATLPPLENLP